MVQAFSGGPRKVARFVILHYVYWPLPFSLIVQLSPPPLGYGATTLPALNEAITFEKKVTFAQSEAGRLQHLIDKLTKKIEI